MITMFILRMYFNLTPQSYISPFIIHVVIGWHLAGTISIFESAFLYIRKDGIQKTKHLK